MDDEIDRLRAANLALTASLAPMHAYGALWHAAEQLKPAPGTSSHEAWSVYFEACGKAHAAGQALLEHAQGSWLRGDPIGLGPP